jgi:hypothetical protein
VIKVIFTDQTKLLHGRNIDQVIMCSIFACSRALKQGLPFRDIIDHYAEFNQYNKEEHDAIVHKIPVQDKEPINLIQFYNSVFVPPLKEIINHTIR